MSDYSQTTFFAPKDALTTGDPLKIIYGAEVDPELDAISTAIATKYDSTDLASQAQAEAETSNAVLLTPLSLAYWSDYNAGIVGDLQALADPAADRLLFWDNSAGAAAFLTASTGLAISTTNIALDINGLDVAAAVDTTNDYVAMYDTSVGGIKKMTISNIAVDSATESIEGKIRIGTSAEAAAGVLDTVVVTPLTLAENLPGTASTSAEGLIEIATDAEFTTGTDTARAVTADQVASITQTMTNKTLTSPTIATATITDPTISDPVVTETVYSVTGTTPALSPNNGTIQTWTLSGNSTPTAGTWAAGQSMTLMIDDGTAYTITWTSVAVTWVNNGGADPTLATSGYTVVVLWKVGSTIYGALVGDGT